MRRPYRGRGLAMIAASMILLRDLGMEEAAPGVHTDDPTGAFRLYEGLGYRVVSTSAAVRKPM